MSGGVKSIFKAIVGTMSIMLISFFVIEYYNISVASPQLKTMTQVALRQSCQYFAQESYKDGSGNAYQIKGAGGLADPSLDGKFYLYADAQKTYDTLYKNSSDFKNYIQNIVHPKLKQNTWRNLDLLGYAMGIPPERTLKNGEDVLAKYYLDDMLTPLNIGVIYLDKNTLTKIFRWELVNILMNGEPNMVIQETPGNNDSNYVFYKGFRLYYNSIQIKNIQYTIYNLDNSSDAKAFQELTNIDVEDYIARSNIGGDDERKYVAIATLQYDMRVGYEGITPIKRAFQWAVNRETGRAQVKGDPINSVDRRYANNWEKDGMGDTATSLSGEGIRNEDANAAYNPTKKNNYNNSSGAFNLDNTIIYYIIR